MHLRPNAEVILARFLNRYSRLQDQLRQLRRAVPPAPLLRLAADLDREAVVVAAGENPPEARLAASRGQARRQPVGHRLESEAGLPGQERLDGGAVGLERLVRGLRLAAAPTPMMRGLKL